MWRRHRAAAARPLGAGAARDPGVYRRIEQAVTRAVEPQLDVLAGRIRQAGTAAARVRLEPRV